MQPGADRLAGLRRAAAAHRDRARGAARRSGRCATTSSRVRGSDDAERLDLVDAGVGGVERARDRVEPDLAGRAWLSEFPSKF